MEKWEENKGIVDFLKGNDGIICSFDDLCRSLSNEYYKYWTAIIQERLVKCGIKHGCNVFTNIADLSCPDISKTYRERIYEDVRCSPNIGQSAGRE